MLMEGLHSPHTIAKPASFRKVPSNSSQKDLWLITQEGSLSALESALLLLKKNGVNIDSRNAFGLTPLHIATWRNNVPIVKRLLAAGADPDARDGESGWSSLHRALHFGHLAVAGVLLQSGASLTLEDCKGRTPIDLLSGPVLQASGSALETVATEVFSWGSGTNYQLGTGNVHIQKLPCKVDALQGFSTKIIASAKFHSVAVGASGELYSWGFGRGGRLGHSDFDIHSGQAAVITPRQVTVGLASRQVKAVAVAKHHTIIATENGEVYTWGSNREGQLGYTSVDTQPTPRRVSSLRQKIVAVAAANKHSAVVAESGEIFTWGCNREGQLGYGTSNSASNYIPRLVESLKGKSFTAISAAKYHTIVLSREGEVFTWGHRLVTPRRVIISRNLKKTGCIPLKFHRMERLHVVSITAGVIHSTALTDDGALFYWASSDPDLRCQQMYSMSGSDVVSISAGKYCTAAVTDTGDVYYWDGKKQKVEIPTPTRLHGVKRATSVSVGETHMLVLCALYHPNYTLKMDSGSKKPLLDAADDLEELDEALIFDITESSRKPATTLDKDDSFQKPIPSLKSLCERTAVELLLETRNAVQLLEIADSLEADNLRAHCEDIAIRNLDFIFAVSAPAITSASLEILAKLEKSLDAKSSESWSYRRLPTPTATFPAVIDIEDDDVDKGRCLRLRDNHVRIMKDDGDFRLESFLHPSKDTDQDTVKQVRALRKKLQQIEMLENKLSNGHTLDDQQVMKLQTRPAIESTLAELGFPVEIQSKFPYTIAIEGKGNKLEEAKKQRRKKKQKEDEPIETTPSSSETFPIEGILKDYADTKINDISVVKENTETSGLGKINITEGFYPESPKGTPRKNANNHMISKPIQSKKKNKKGGLSMFLSGALDDTPKEIILPPPKKEGPAWGGAKVLKGSSSLRDIQDEESKLKGSQPIKIQNDHFKDSIESKIAGHIRLSSFLPGAASKSTALTPPRDVPMPEAEKSTPPWSQGTSGSSRPSLRDIQNQQEKKHSISNSPKIRTTGFTTSTGQAPSTEISNWVNDAPNRWFKPETDAPSSIRSIQIEEKAMKEFKRYYNSVKLVKAQHQGS